MTSPSVIDIDLENPVFDHTATAAPARAPP
jgi:hypothetical protein